MDGTSKGGAPGAEGTDDLMNRISDALAKAERTAATAPSSAYPIRPPKSLAELSDGVWRPGRSAHGGDIPERWIPPEFTDRLEYGDASSKSREAGS
jgi:hypothetical protein